MLHLINWYKANYRIWKSFKTMPKVIQQTGYWPSETYMKYPKNKDFRGKKVLNFGCGKSVFTDPNAINLDVYPHEGVQVVCTTNKLPFADASFDLVVANHVLEHVPNWFESFKELARVTKPGGLIDVWIPPVYSDTAHTYRDHINRIGIQSFSGCLSLPLPGHNLSAEHDFKEVGDVAKLQLITFAKRPAVKWWTMLAWPSLLEFFTTHLRNTVSEEQFLFEKH